MAGRFYLPRSTAFDANGDPISGAKLEFFESGTSTPLDTFSDDALTVANTNPVIADSAGRFGDIFLQQSDYKVTLSDASDNVIWTTDPVRSDAPKSSVVREVTTTTVLDSSDDGKLIVADATAGGFVITLEAVADAGNGSEVTIMKIDSSANAVTVDANGAETINGSSDFTLSESFASIALRTDGTAWYIESATPSVDSTPLPAGYISGLEISNAPGDAEHDIVFSAGRARSSDNQGNIVLTSDITKRIDAAFAEGTNQGGLDTGTVAADTVYYAWVIAKVDGTTDGLFSLSSSLPTIPSGFTRRRVIGWLRTDSDSNLMPFTWKENGEYDWGLFDESASAVNSVTHGAIPSGVDEIELWFRISDVAGTAGGPEIELGTSSGIETTGYDGGTFRISGSTAGSEANSASFLLANTALVVAGDTVTGRASLKRFDSTGEAANRWQIITQSGENGAVGFFGHGLKDLGDELTQFRISDTGGDNFDIWQVRYVLRGQINPRTL